ncbi:hypothetical protein FAF44_25705 [Nonomuraea sp. MG754425]|uniref:hypothetical protein n=1 Tax=Nonomuraea sp. MG754425 TaxID=2570319 RepID=UPI001F3896CB|nr:hypothetical protein [Nonomuraea sp. MG754425]MCF6471766.1 hypothetical protein [Nonomuraea sp. MG754425]
MTGQAPARRFWQRLIGARPAAVPAVPLVRDRSGGLPSRFWAALIGAPLFLPAAPAAPQELPAARLTAARPPIALLAQRARAARDGGDPKTIRVADAALCTAMLSTPPDGSWPELRPLLEEIRAGNRFLAFVVDRVLGSGPPDSRRLETDLAYASDADLEPLVLELDWPPFVARLTVEERRLRLGLSVRLEQGEAGFVERAYGVMVLPVALVSDVGSTPYLLALAPGGDGLRALIDLPLPPGRFLAAAPNGAPIGVAEAGSLDLDLVRDSIAAIGSVSGLLPWQEIAASLPSGHPVRQVIDAEAH